MRRMWALGFLILLAGCVDSKIVPLLGNWAGEFKVASVEGKTDAKETSPYDFKAYLQLYRTHDKFKMRLENKLQAVEITGTWKRLKHQIELIPSDFHFENPTEDEQKTRGLKIVQPDEMRAAYGKTFHLDLSPDEKELNGPAMTLGNLSGHHAFAKGMSPPGAEREYDRMRKTN